MPVSSPSEFVPTFAKAFEVGDTDALLDLYADEIVAVPQPGARLTGKTELGAGLGAFLAMAPYTMNFTQAGLIENADHALVLGDWTFDGASPDGPVHIEARASIVLMRQGDGWYAVLDDFFSQG